MKEQSFFYSRITILSTIQDIILSMIYFTSVQSETNRRSSSLDNFSNSILSETKRHTKKCSSTRSSYFLTGNCFMAGYTCRSNAPCIFSDLFQSLSRQSYQQSMKFQNVSYNVRNKTYLRVYKYFPKPAYIYAHILFSHFFESNASHTH